jgi:polyhydroxybutyrate depolymerase
MGHTWPGREPMFATLGATTHNLIANDVIWDFFERHRR